MANENLTRITELSAAFKNAVEASPEAQNPKLQAKAMKALKPGELAEIQGLLEEVLDESLEYAFGGEPSEDFLKKNIKLCEITADLFTRILSPEKVARYVPDELKNKEDAATLRSVGAKKLASLCELKIK